MCLLHKHPASALSHVLFPNSPQTRGIRNLKNDIAFVLDKLKNFPPNKVVHSFETNLKEAMSDGVHIFVL